MENQFAERFFLSKYKAKYNQREGEGKREKSCRNNHDATKHSSQPCCLAPADVGTTLRGKQGCSQIHLLLKRSQTVGRLYTSHMCPNTHTDTHMLLRSWTYGGTRKREQLSPGQTELLALLGNDGAL